MAVTRARRRSARQTLRVYRALRRKGYDRAKSLAIARYGATHERRSAMVRKGHRSRRE